MKQITNEEKPARGPGRPWPEDHVLGKRFISIFPPNLLMEIDKAADKEGIPRSEWLKRAALAKLGKAKSEVSDTELAELRKEANAPRLPEESDISSLEAAYDLAMSSEHGTGAHIALLSMMNGLGFSVTGTQEAMDLDGLILGKATA